MEIFKLVLGVAIFIVTFYYIISEKYPKSLVAIIGGSLMVVSGILNEEEALETIGYNLEVIFLLVGMMIIVHIISETGVFQWFAIKVAQLAKGEPFRLIILLSVVTALCSAFLDNVTTILLMAPVSILLANQLRLDPFPFIISEVMSANIGGVATLIGDPTQLIIGSEGHLGFNEFLMNTSPMAIVSMVILILNVYFIYGKNMHVSRELKARIMELDSSRSLKDVKLLKEAALIFSLVLAGFYPESYRVFRLYPSLAQFGRWIENKEWLFCIWQLFPGA